MEERRKAENGDIKPAPLVSRRTASHALYPTELNFPLEYRGIPPCLRLNHEARITRTILVSASIARQQSSDGVGLLFDNVSSFTRAQIVETVG